MSNVDTGNGVVFVGVKLVQGVCWLANERSLGWHPSSAVDWIDRQHETQ